MEVVSLTYETALHLLTPLIKLTKLSSITLKSSSWLNLIYNAHCVSQLKIQKCLS